MALAIWGRTIYVPRTVPELNNNEKERTPKGPYLYLSDRGYRYPLAATFFSFFNFTESGLYKFTVLTFPSIFSDMVSVV